MKITSRVLLSGIAALVLLTGCSKPAAPEPAAATSEDSTDRPAPQAPVAPPAKPQKSHAEQAATLLQYIDARPECQQFRAPLEQASATPTGATVELNMGEIMDQAYKAGCQKGPG
jgi:TolA-binding protein